MEIYLIGGTVRDSLMDLPIKDKDYLVVGATPSELIAKGYMQVGKDFPVFLHPQTKDEYALARTERKTGGGHTGFSFDASTTVSLEEDLSRRDLTINAIAQDAQGHLHDPFNGQSDLRNGILRHVSPAFIEDPLRLFRVARFTARFCKPLVDKNFTIAPETLELMQAMVASGELDHLSAERIWNELHKALTYAGSVRFFETLHACHAHRYVFTKNDELFHLACERLSLTSAKQYPADVRYASYTSALGNEHDITALNQSLKAPNAFAKLALISAQLINRLNTATHARDRLYALTQAGAFNNTTYLHKALTLAELFCDQAHTVSLLKTCLSDCQAISAKPFIEQGFTGGAIQEQMNQAREAVIDGVFKMT